MRDHGQEEGEVSDKSTISPARNITHEQRRVWNRYFDCGLTFDAISEFLMLLCAFLTPFTSILRLLDLVLGRIYRKIIKSRYSDHFLIIGQIIIIDGALP